jgi:hypothetical protein
MTSIETEKSATPTPVVEDPHPGSVSDGTHPEAKERKPPGTNKHEVAKRDSTRTAGKPALKSGQTGVNSEAPKHPNKGAYGS